MNGIWRPYCNYDYLWSEVCMYQLSGAAEWCTYVDINIGLNTMMSLLLLWWFMISLVRILLSRNELKDVDKVNMDHLNANILANTLLFLLIPIDYNWTICHYDSSIVDYISKFKTTVTWYDLWFAVTILTYYSLMVINQIHMEWNYCCLVLYVDHNTNN